MGMSLDSPDILFELSAVDPACCLVSKTLDATHDKRSVDVFRCVHQCLIAVPLCRQFVSAQVERYLNSPQRTPRLFLERLVTLSSQ